MLTSPLYQQIVDNAQAATGARLVHIAWLDPVRGEVHVGAMSGLHTAALRRGFAAVARFAPDFDPFSLHFDVAVNPWNQVVFAEGRSVAVPLEQIAAGAVPAAIVRVAVTIVGLRYTFCCPLRQGQGVAGTLSFHTARPLTVAQRHTCEAFARQAALTLENADLLVRAERARANAEATERALRTVLANAPVVLIGLDPSGVLTLVEGKALQYLGVMPGEGVGGPPHSTPGAIVPLLDAASSVPVAEAASATVEAGGRVYDVRRELLREEQTESGGTLVVGIDITERHRAQVTERERARLEGALLAARTAQHELNNELAAVSGYTELIANDLELPPYLRELSHEVLAAVQRAALTVDQLRRITRIKEVERGGPGSVLDLRRSSGPSESGVQEPAANPHR
jgi:PAS domain-containing protein